MLLDAILFDLDGTVIETGPLIAKSFRHAVSTVLGEPIQDEEMLAYVGGWSLREQDVQALARPLRGARRGLSRLQRAPSQRARVLRGHAELLLELRTSGARLGLATAKRRSTVEIALPGLEDLFGVIVTSEDIEPHKPNPEPLLLALRKLETTPAEAAYVGDSPFDVEAAKAAGLRSIAVTWGGIHPEQRLRTAGPDAIVATPAELLTVLSVSPA
jgi:pyrophosphatase PpaX